MMLTPEQAAEKYLNDRGLSHSYDNTPIHTWFRENWPKGEVVEVTAADFMYSYRAVNLYNVHPTECVDMVRELNTRLCARGGKTSPTLVKRPTERVTPPLIVPENGHYFIRIREEWNTHAVYFHQNDCVSGIGFGDVTAIRSYDRKTGATGAVIERTEIERTGQWTTDTIPHANRPFWYWSNLYPAIGIGSALKQETSAARVNWMNSTQVTAWCYVNLPKVTS